MVDDGPVRSSQSPERKRKRDVTDDDGAELEIDLNLPEPLSKKASRKLKKAKPEKVVVDVQSSEDGPKEKERSSLSSKEAPPASTRSEWAVWIGNLLWSTTKDNLRDFLVSKGDIDKSAITRLHMPPPADKGPKWKGPKPVNKGFVYVDFDTEANMNKAIALSETLLDGRKVLIKNAKSFEGRPEAKSSDTAVAPEKAPSKRIFVGNLGFDTTVDDVREHFQQAGTVEDVFLTTFEDSGKCKGYGWVRFGNVEAAQAAVNGFVYQTTAAANSGGDESEGDDDNDEAASDKATKRAAKPRKWFINRLQGRSLRTEFAEDSQTRYKKRFGKEQTRNEAEEADSAGGGGAKTISRRPDKDERQALRRQKHEDARRTAPGKALATAQRASAAIVSSAGKKTTFD